MDAAKRAEWVGGLKIGSEVWVYDGYARYGEHPYKKEEIVGETRVSWLVGFFKNKRPKKTGAGMYSEQETHENEWVGKNAWKTSERVRQCRDYDTLKAIVELLDKGEKKNG